MIESLLAGPSGVLVCDGATGTVLHAAGHPLDQQLPHLNLSSPDVVRAVHDAYLHSGVDVVQTNTFGATRLRLRESGLDGHIEQINREGVRIAREAADAVERRVLVAGSVSPAVSVHQRGRVLAAERPHALREQLEVLVSSGVDLLVLETFGYLDELVEAVEAAADLGVPVIAQATFTEDERMLSGHSAADLARAVPEDLVTALGTNCTLGPHGCLSVVRELARHTGVPLAAQPNAGLPRRVGPSRFEYAIDSDYLVRYVRQLVDAGAAIVGGCCGTTPAQIGAVVEIVREHRRTRPVAARETPAAPPPRSFLLAAELSTPPPDHLRNGVGALVDAGLDAVVVPAPAPGRTRVNPVHLAVQVGDRTDADAIVCIPAWGRALAALQADLLGAHALGVRRIVCESGSAPPAGDYPRTDDAWDVDALRMVALLRGLNEGRDHHGVELGSTTAFEIGTRVNLGRDDLDAALRQAVDEIDAGATFLLTGPIYELDSLDRLLAALESTRTPVLVSVRPLTTVDDAEYLRHEVPDVRVPDVTVARLARAGPYDREPGRRLAVELAAGVAARAQGLVVCGPEASDVGFVERLAGVCRGAVTA